MTHLTEEQIRAIVREEMTAVKHDIQIVVRGDAQAVDIDRLRSIVPEIMNNHHRRLG